jgi:GlpG protein
MLWLLSLGGQIENRLGWARYLVFILLAAAIPNIGQYLIGGYNFVGYSGVVCAMIGFIWMRQRIAAWEGYLLAPNTVTLVSIFVIGLTLLQCYSFYMEWTTGQGLPAVMANTAHMAGGIVGILLGRLPLFAWQQGR